LYGGGGPSKLKRSEKKADYLLQPSTKVVTGTLQRSDHWTGEGNRKGLSHKGKSWKTPRRDGKLGETEAQKETGIHRTWHLEIRNKDVEGGGS